MNIGKFITFEGGEGTGKSTQAQRLAQRLEEAGRSTALTREPGGSKKGERIREFLLSDKARNIGPLAEAILFSAARDDHLVHVIRPALKIGKWVVSDRFADSTRAYQASASLKPELITALEDLVVGKTRPNLTIILDFAADKGLARADERRSKVGRPADGFEARDLEFHKSLRQNFLAIAEAEPERCVVIDADQSEEFVAEAIWSAVEDRLKPQNRE
jgi:dTMP kinase